MAQTIPERIDDAGALLRAATNLLRSIADDQRSEGAEDQDVRALAQSLTEDLNHLEYVGAMAWEEYEDQQESRRELNRALAYA